MLSHAILGGGQRFRPGHATVLSDAQVGFVTSATASIKFIEGLLRPRALIGVCSRAE